MLSIITPATARYTITCKLCDARIAEAPPLEIPVTGPLGRKAEKIEEMLQKHLYQRHPEEVKQAAEIAKGFIPFLVWNAFHTEDPSVPPRVEAARAPIFAMVRRYSFTDEQIQTAVAAFITDPDDAAKLTELLRTIRDACCEFGKFSPPDDGRPA